MGKHTESGIEKHTWQYTGNVTCSGGTLTQRMHWERILNGGGIYGEPTLVVFPQTFIILLRVIFLRARDRCDSGRKAGAKNIRSFPSCTPSSFSANIPRTGLIFFAKLAISKSSRQNRGSVYRLPQWIQGEQRRKCARGGNSNVRETKE